MIHSINGMFTPSGDHIVYATGDGPVYKRSNQVWNNIFLEACSVVDISPSGKIYTGGYTGFWSPFIATSTDQGNSWSSITFENDTIGGPIVSFAFHLTDPNVAYARGS